MKRKTLLKEFFNRILGTIFIPLTIYCVLYLTAKHQGLTYFGNGNSWRNIILNTGAAATIAYALATQIRAGRFDFSGGAIMTLGALVSIFISVRTIQNGFFFLAVCIVICVSLSLFVAYLYVLGRIPMIICSVGAAVFFESITLIFNNGQGATISSNPSMNFLGKNVGPLLSVMLLSMCIYLIYTNYTTSGRRAQLLAGNQESAVNIGINENQNVIQSFIISGLLYGIAAVIFASQKFQVDVVPTVLGTVSVAFSSMLPVFMGFFIGSFSTAAIGIIFSSLSVGILQYGIDVIAPTGYSGAFKNIIMGIFMIVFFLVSRKGRRIAIALKKRLYIQKQNQQKNNSQGDMKR